MLEERRKTHAKNPTETHDALYLEHVATDLLSDVTFKRIFSKTIEQD